MTTSDDRLVNASVGSSGHGNEPLGLILNQLIMITMILKEGFGLNSLNNEDFSLLSPQAPNFVSGAVTPTSPSNL